MEENEELKKDMRLMVDEMDELQDNFRLGPQIFPSLLHSDIFILTFL